MKVRNCYGNIPKEKSSGLPLMTWYCVEEEPGIAVGGDDYVFDFEDKETAERVAEALAAQTDSRLTVVRYTRFEEHSYRRKTTVEREG